MFVFVFFVQRWWRHCLLRDSTLDSDDEEAAAMCLQAAWRGYRERRWFRHQRDSAVVIQRRWRHFCQRRYLAAVTVQAAWRGFRERSRYRRMYGSVTQLQALGRGYVARLRWVKVKCNL